MEHALGAADVFVKVFFLFVWETSDGGKDVFETKT